ncbi:MAG: DUF1232 domain-containing protein [Anaerolineaceae bacterium]|nr:DUF1232 domain-containing protein [Anaerolineaceae bacterium]
MEKQPERPADAVIEHEVERKRNKAEDYLRDPEKSKQLLDEAVKKANEKEEKKGPLTDVWNSLTALFRLFNAYIHKEYTHIPWGSIVLVVVAIIYFVSPIDLLPDWIPLGGFIDDAAVIGFVLKQINTDLEQFLKWEAVKKSLDSVVEAESAN